MPDAAALTGDTEALSGRKENCDAGVAPLPAAACEGADSAKSGGCSALHSRKKKKNSLNPDVDS